MISDKLIGDRLRSGQNIKRRAGIEFGAFAFEQAQIFFGGLKFYCILLRLQRFSLRRDEKGTRCESWTLPDAVSSAKAFLLPVSHCPQGWEGREKVE